MSHSVRHGSTLININIPRLSMIDSFSLKFISGQLPKSTNEFSVTNTQLSALPQLFFSELVLLTGFCIHLNYVLFPFSINLHNSFQERIPYRPGFGCFTFILMMCMIRFEILLFSKTTLERPPFHTKLGVGHDEAKAGMAVRAVRYKISKFW